MMRRLVPLFLLALLAALAPQFAGAAPPSDLRAGDGPPVPGRAGEYEPNDVPAQATSMGPSGSVYAATIETTADVDMYEFYVATDATPVYLTVTNTTPKAGGIVSYSDIGTELRDASGDVIDYETLISEGQAATIGAPLAPGRYNLVVMWKVDFFNDNIQTYNMTFTGATADEATMQAHCDAATAEAKMQSKKVRKAKKKIRHLKVRGAKLSKVRKAKYALKYHKKQRNRARHDKESYCVVV